MSEMSNTAEVDALGARRISRPAQMLQILRGKRPKDTGLEPLPGNGPQVDLMHGDLLAKPGLEEIRIMRSYGRSEEHTSELQSLMRISYAVFCLKKKITNSIPYNKSLTSFLSYKSQQGQ